MKEQIIFDASAKLLNTDILRIALHLACYEIATKEHIGESVENLELIAEEKAANYIADAVKLYKHLVETYVVPD